MSELAEAEVGWQRRQPSREERERRMLVENGTEEDGKRKKDGGGRVGRVRVWRGSVPLNVE